MNIEVPADLKNAKEQALLDLAAKCANVQAEALTELQARPGRNREYEQRLSALPEWRRAAVKTLSSKWIAVMVAIVVGLISLASSAVEFTNNAGPLRDTAKAKMLELEQMRQQGSE